MSEEMTIPNHSHADQRNWQPGDMDDDCLTFEQLFAIPRVLNRVLRTLERMRRLTGIPPEALAAAISPHIRIDHLIEAAVYLEEVANCIGKQMPQWKCAECGKDIWFKDTVCCTVNVDGKPGLSTTREIQRVRHDARYCSRACRQKAYRKRNAARYGKKPRRNRPAVTNSESVTEAAHNEAAEP